MFYKKTLGGENVGKLYYRDGWKGTEQLLFDPAGFTPTGAKPGDVATIVGYTPSPDGQHVVLGTFRRRRRVFRVASASTSPAGSCSPRRIYPSYGALSWTMDSKSFLYDAGKVTDIKSPEIELNRKTRLHTLGTDVAADTDFFSNESYPDLEISPKEFPMAFIDESYPDYVVGNVGTVQNEMRLFLAPTAQMTPNGKLKWSVLCVALRQPGPRHCLLQGPCLRGHARRRTQVQDRPHARRSSGLEDRRNGRARGQGLDPVHHSQQEFSVRCLLRTGSSAAW